MTYAFDGEVITEVADFKEKGLMTSKGGEGEKRYSENKFAHAGVACAKGKSVDHYINCTLV